MGHLSSGIILAIIAFSLGIASLTRSPKTPALLLFSRLSLAIGLVFLSQAFAHIFFWQRVGMVGIGMFIPHTILFFDLFPDPVRNPSQSKSKSLWFLGFSLCTLAFLPNGNFLENRFLGRTVPAWIIYSSIV